MILLDTTVLSGLMRDLPAAAVVAWLDKQEPARIWTPGANKALKEVLRLAAGKPVSAFSRFGEDRKLCCCEAPFPCFPKAGELCS